MLKIKEILFRTMLNEGQTYEDRYIFKGDINDLEKYNFRKLKPMEMIEELKVKVGQNENIYYKKSGLGYFIAFIEDEKMVFMSGVPIWWIGDEEETDYYKDLELMKQGNLVEKVGD